MTKNSSMWIEYVPTVDGERPAGVDERDGRWEVEWYDDGQWVPSKRLAWVRLNRYRYRPSAAHSGGPTLDPKRQVSLPEDVKLRAEYPMFDGFMAYFPNAMAEVSRLSHLATQQHHPEAGMHWDRSKSTDHLNKIGRHMVDAGKLDDNGLRHSVMLAWRAMANLQEELERDLGLPPSPGSRNRPY